MKTTPALSNHAFRITILVLVGHEELLAIIFREVLIPPAVESEFVRLAATDGRFAGLRVPAWAQVRAPAEIPGAIANDSDLDEGEMQALALALEIHADGVLIDEAHGRAVAIGLGMVAIGVLGILVRAKKHGLLPAVAPLIESLLTRARFRMGDELDQTALRLADER